MPKTKFIKFDIHIALDLNKPQNYSKGSQAGHALPIDKLNLPNLKKQNYIFFLQCTIWRNSQNFFL